MKKDYILIQSQEQDLNDLSFVETFWTERWQSVDLGHTGNKVRHISRRKEYQVMRLYLERLPKGSKLLDAGCGLGAWTVLLAEQGYDVVGLDISEPTIKALNSHFPELDFVHGDIRAMDFPDDHFDAVFSWGAFEHFELGLQPCIVESWRVLKPGGYLFITVPYHNLRHILRDFRDWEFWDAELAAQLTNNHQRSQSPIRFYQWRLTRPELARELAIGGFKVLDVVPVQVEEGLRRTLAYDLKLKPDTANHRMGFRILRRLVPGKWVAHMIMAVAQKPHGDEE